MPFDGTAEPQNDAVIAVERWASRLARLVLLLTALADRYDAAAMDTSAAAWGRDALRRSAIQAGRRALAAVALGPTPEGEPTHAGAWQADRGGSPSAAAGTAGEALQARLGAEAIVALAQGMLMHRCRIDPDQALAALRTAAREGEVTVLVYARDMVNAVSSAVFEAASPDAPTPHQLPDAAR